MEGGQKRCATEVREREKEKEKGLETTLPFPSLPPLLHLTPVSSLHSPPASLPHLQERGEGAPRRQVSNSMRPSPPRPTRPRLFGLYAL